MGPRREGKRKGHVKGDVERQRGCECDTVTNVCNANNKAKCCNNDVIQNTMNAAMYNKMMVGVYASGL